MLFGAPNILYSIKYMDIYMYIVRQHCVLIVHIALFVQSVQTSLDG